MFLLVLLACDQAAPPIAAPVAAPEAMSAPAAMPAANHAAAITGTVAETIPAGEYIYTRVHPATGDDTWAAAPGPAPAVGSTVSVSTAMPMKDFHSDTLSRDFPLVYFVSSYGGDSATVMTMPVSAAPPPVGAAPAPPRAASAAPDTQTIAAIVTGRTKLAGQKVTVTGDVVKSTSGVMGRNWIHIKDAAGTNDLTVTSTQTAAVGERIQVTGTVAIDQDFGSGYSYPVMVTDAVFAGG